MNYELDGEYKLSANFKLKEFACKDGTKEILLDPNLVILLQKIRDRFNKPVSITSAYRTKLYNAKVGGTSNSQHLLGKAADITISGITPLEVAKAAQQLGAKGIGLYAGFTHVDTRSTKYYWKQVSSGSNVEVSSFV